jgi:predicted RecA/RadA family phage recombinase
MAANFVQPGEVLKLTAPSGGVVAGTPKLIGSIVVVPPVTAAQTVQFSAMVTGVATVAKATGATWSEGEKIYWDVGDGNFNTSAGGNTLAGVAVEAALSGATTGKLRFDGVVR